jgi:bacterioferritin (cytochrome b1)
LARSQKKIGLSEIFADDHEVLRHGVIETQLALIQKIGLQNYIQLQSESAE